jgi:membrane protein DedA with SNARE-associated domain
MESLDATLPYLVRYSYLGVFGLILVFSFVLPFSKTLVILGAGILAAQGIGSLPAYMLVSLAGLVTADSIYYFLGYWGGERVLEWRLFSGPDKEKRFRAAEARFRRHEWLAVFTARFLPFLRSLVFVVAGLSRMPPLRFFWADFLSACILVPVAIASGYFFAENREALVRYVKEGEFVLGVVICLVLAILFFFPRKPGRDGTPE